MKIKNQLRVIFYGILISVFIQTNTFSQGRTLSFSEWISEMQSSDGEYLLENATIEYNEVTDKRFDAKLYSLDSLNFIVPVNYSTITINREVVLKDVEFKNIASVQFYKLIFNKPVHFTKVTAERIYFDETIFKDELNFTENNIDRLTLSVCTFKKNLEIADNETEFLTFNNCVFNGDNNIYDDKMDIVFSACKFLGKKTKSNAFTTHLNVGTSHGTENQLRISNCYFKKSAENDLINLGSSKLSALTLINDTIEVMLWMPFLRTKSIYFAENQFLNKVDVTNISLPLDDSNIRWAQLAGKIVVNTGYKTSYRNYVPYQARTEKELANSFKYSELIAAYSKFFNLYKLLSDAESANACYVEMKNIETNRLQFLYKTQNTTKAWFDWKVNEFLKYFCLYGTDPSASIIIGVKIVLLFSILYFFIPSVDDNLKKNRVLAALNRYIAYTTTYQKISEIGMKEHEDEFQRLENLRQTLEELNDRVPLIIKLIGKPFYWLSMIYFQLSFWLLEIGTLSAGVWYKLPKRQKMISGFILTLHLSGFILAGFVTRIVNALVLSLIAFISLGYGEMSPKGYAKYLTAIQGVLGWFCLSIFSVSLISQILQ